MVDKWYSVDREMKFCQVGIFVTSFKQLPLFYRHELLKRFYKFPYSQPFKLVTQDTVNCNMIYFPLSVNRNMILIQSSGIKIQNEYLKG